MIKRLSCQQGHLHPAQTTDSEIQCAAFATCFHQYLHGADSVSVTSLVSLPLAVWSDSREALVLLLPVRCELVSGLMTTR